MTPHVGTGDGKGLRARALGFAESVIMGVVGSGLASSAAASTTYWSPAAGFFAGWAPGHQLTVFMVSGTLPAAAARLKLLAPGADVASARLIG